MKKRILYVLSFIAIGLAVLLVFNIKQQYQRKAKVALQKQILPAFSLYNQKLQRFSLTQLTKNKSVCVFYYNAECEHCQYEAQQISKNIAAFKEVQIVMISTNDPQETLRFSTTYNLENYPFITWLYDKDDVFYKWFGQSVCPSVYLYNTSHQLQKEYIGEVKIGAVIKQIQHAQQS